MTQTYKVLLFALSFILPASLFAQSVYFEDSFQGTEWLQAIKPSTPTLTPVVTSYGTWQLYNTYRTNGTTGLCAPDSVDLRFVKLDGYIITPSFNFGVGTVYVKEGRGTLPIGVFTSTDYGTTWVSAGTITSVKCTYATLAVNNAAVNRIKLTNASTGSGKDQDINQMKVTSAVPISVRPEPSTTITSYSIANYPNPFNPSTTIRFEIPRASKIAVSVYNIMGQRVATLFDGYLTAGAYSTPFEAKDLTSGLYVYRLEGENVSLTRKMILMK
jgi:hypothetical protein